jgi:hypothetical protein
VSITLGLLSVAAAATLHVGPGQPYGTLSDALSDSRAGDEVVLEPGEYMESVTVRRAVTIRGAGQGVTILRRDSGKWTLRLEASTTLESLTIDARGRRAVDTNGADRVAIIDTEITGGDTIGDALIEASAVSAGATLLMQDSWIHDNRSNHSAVDARGDLTVDNCVFERNVHEGSYGAGAIYHWAGSGDLQRIRNNLFVANTSTSDGGAITLFTESRDGSSTQVEGNTFYSNHSDTYGGGAYIASDVSFFGFPVRVTIKDNTFADNSAGRGGGGVALMGVDYGYYYGGYAPGDFQLRFGSATMVGNRAPNGSHIYVNSDLQVHLANVLMAHGKDGAALWVGADVGERDHLLFWDNGDDVDGWVSEADVGPSSVWADPLFAQYSDNGDPFDDDLSLLPGSPALDAGDPRFVPDADGSASDIGAR